MASLVCIKCGTHEHVATVVTVPWCHNCFYGSYPAYRPADELASRRVWRSRAAQGLPAPVAGEALVQTIGMLFRMRS